MSVLIGDHVIKLSGDCGTDDAEQLVAALQARQELALDLSEARHLHTAVLQVLMAFRPSLSGPAGDPFIEEWLVPCIQGKPQRIGT